MDKPSPPFTMLMHPKYRDTPFDELPVQLQKRLLKYQARQGQVEEIEASDPVATVVPEEVVEPADEVEDPKGEAVEEEEEDSSDDSEETEADNADDSDDDSEEFPVHTGGGYYELSNGERVRGLDDAIEAQAELD